MKNVMLLTLAISIILMSGCASKIIFNEDFDSSVYGTPNQYPSGPPNSDMIIVKSPANPLVEGNYQLIFDAKIVDEDGSTFFVSHPLDNTGNDRTIYWVGTLSMDNEPIVFRISGGDIPSSTDQITSYYLELQIWQTEAKLILKTTGGPTELESAPISGGLHKIYIILGPKFKGYKITITSTGEAEIKWIGSTPPKYLDWLKDHPRMLMQAKFPSITQNSKYTMDNIIMREKK